MEQIIIAIAGIGLILYGLVVLTRRKLIEKPEYEYILISIILATPLLSNYLEKGYKLFYLLGIIIVVILPIYLILIMLNRGKIDIINVNIDMVRTTLINILTEKNISYEEKENTIILKEYDKVISYKGRFSSVNLRLTEIRNLHFYKYLRSEFKIRIKEIEKDVFPFQGVFNIIIGILIVVAMYYI